MEAVSKTKSILQSLGIDNQKLKEIQKILDSPEERGFREYLKQVRELIKQTSSNEQFLEVKEEIISEDFMDSEDFNHDKYVQKNTTKKPELSKNKEGGTTIITKTNVQEEIINEKIFSEEDREFAINVILNSNDLNVNKLKRFLNEVLDETEYDIKTYYDIFIKKIQTEKSKNISIGYFVENVPITDNKTELTKYLETLVLDDENERDMIIRQLNSMTQNSLKQFTSIYDGKKDFVTNLKSLKSVIFGFTYKQEHLLEGDETDGDETDDDEKDADDDDDDILKPDIKKSLEIILEKPNLNLDEQKCINKYSTLPWLSNIDVDKIYVNTEDEELKNVLNVQRVIVEHDGKKWFQVGKRFFLVQCLAKTSFSGKDTMILYDRNRDIRLSVLYKTKEGTYHVYDRDDYKKQQFHFQKEIMISKKELLHILQRKITDSMVNEISKNLSSLLQSIHNNRVYSLDSDFVSKVISTVRHNSNTNGELLNKYAELSVYLQRILPESELKTPLFWQRLAVEYYIPEMLSELTKEEKLPEVFNESQIQNSEQILSTINKNKKRIISEIAISNIKSINPNKKIKTNLKSDLHTYDLANLQLKLPKLVCNNKEQIKDIPDYDLIMYKEHNELYCFSIKETYNNIKEGNVKNPYTNREFNKDFLERIEQIYNISIEKPVVKDEIIIPGLFDLLLEKLLEMEAYELINDSLSPISSVLLTSNERVCKNCKQVVSPDTRLKTINITPDGKVHVLYFLSADCFTNFNEFNYPDDEFSDDDTDLDIDDDVESVISEISQPDSIIL